VIEPFADAYRRGRTPVPCVSCNKNLKFGSLLQRARAWDAAGVATGHYARVTHDAATGRHLLWRGRDARKDQSDFLWPLSQEQLAAARFPVGDLTKDEVRAQARRLDLATAEAPESQELCFIPDHDYRGFLGVGPTPSSRGDRRWRRAVVGATPGRQLYHRTAQAWAQRRARLRGRSQTRTVRWGRDLGGGCWRPGQFHRLCAARAPRRAAKIRHNHAPASATVRMVDPGTAEVVFQNPSGRHPGHPWSGTTATAWWAEGSSCARLAPPGAVDLASGRVILFTNLVRD
jgi:hypothetical protein